VRYYIPVAFFQKGPKFQEFLEKKRRKIAVTLEEETGFLNPFQLRYGGYPAIIVAATLLHAGICDKCNNR
jgi:hypothetical protein